jgi:hypothetical protein
MTLAFTPCTGAVSVAREGCTNADVFAIRVNGSEINAIITGMSLEMSGNYQFLHTVNDFIYFYSFGDRVGQLTINGIGFVSPCKGEEKGPIMTLYDYYMTNRASKRRGKAMPVTLADGSGHVKTFHGFLTGMRLDVNDGALGTVGYWTLRFDVIPQRS